MIIRLSPVEKSRREKLSRECSYIFDNDVAYREHLNINTFLFTYLRLDWGQKI